MSPPCVLMAYNRIVTPTEDLQPIPPMRGTCPFGIGCNPKRRDTRGGCLSFREARFRPWMLPPGKDGPWPARAKSPARWSPPSYRARSGSKEQHRYSPCSRRRHRARNLAFNRRSLPPCAASSKQASNSSTRHGKKSSSDNSYEGAHGSIR